MIVERYRYTVFPTQLLTDCKFAIFSRDMEDDLADLVNIFEADTLQEIADWIEEHLPGKTVRWHINQMFIL